MTEFRIQFFTMFTSRFCWKTANCMETCVFGAFFLTKCAAVHPLTCCRKAAIHRPWQHSSEWCDPEKVPSLCGFLCSMTLSFNTNRYFQIFSTCSHYVSVFLISLLPVDYWCGCDQGCLYLCIFACHQAPGPQHIQMKRCCKQVKEPSYITAIDSFVQCKKLLCKIHILKRRVKWVPWHIYLNG